MKNKWKFSSTAMGLFLLSAALVIFMPQIAFTAENTILMRSEKNASGEAIYHKITASESLTKIETNPDIIIVDVRRQDEYDAGHINNAILIPLETFSDTMPTLLADQNAEILVYCRTGMRSQRATEKLLALGYTNVHDLGGIRDWPYAIVQATP